jgi:hypothetical protein
MTSRLRKFFLTAHIATSVGWLGAVVAYLALALAGLASRDEALVRAAFLGLELIGWFVIVPLSLGTLVTGLVQSLGTPWGLFRYFWVLAKFALTVVGTSILLQHMRSVSQTATLARSAASGVDYGDLPLRLVIHAVGGLLLLLTATVLSVYKPWGKTGYGRGSRAGTTRDVTSPSAAG